MVWKRCTAGFKCIHWPSALQTVQMVVGLCSRHGQHGPPKECFVRPGSHVFELLRVRYLPHGKLCVGLCSPQALRRVLEVASLFQVRMPRLLSPTPLLFAMRVWGSAVTHHRQSVEKVPDSSLDQGLAHGFSRTTVLPSLLRSAMFEHTLWYTCGACMALPMCLCLCFPEHKLPTAGPKPKPGPRDPTCTRHAPDSPLPSPSLNSQSGALSLGL